MGKIISKEAINDWLTYIDYDIILNKESELSSSKKVLVLDSIDALNFIREATDNTPINLDKRLQYLVDLCLLPCRNDYYQRFLGYRSQYYRTQEDWWNDCWQSIRLNNILHEMYIRPIGLYFSEASDGKNFAEKWPRFYNHANRYKESSNSLTAFSYLECIRLLTNLGKKPPFEDLNNFLYKLCEKNGGKLKLFERSVEIRANALSVIDLINKKWSTKYDFYKSYSELFIVLKEMLFRSEWNQFSNSWAPILTKLSDEDVIRTIKSKIPTTGEIDQSWISGNNYNRKPRFALLSMIHQLDKKDEYFKLIEPNRFVYTAPYYVNSYLNVAHIIDNVIKAFDDNKDIQRKVQDDDITEEYFRDLVKLGLSSHKGSAIEWVEKERAVSSGRSTDILISVNEGPDIPVEAKLLWRFKDGYEPITEVLEQTINGTLAITVVINLKSNPLYQKKYQGLEGWKNYVEDHATYIPGTIRESIKFSRSYEVFKSKHFFSDHLCKLGERTRNVTLLNFFVDLRDFIRSPSLKELK